MQKIVSLARNRTKPGTILRWQVLKSVFKAEIKEDFKVLDIVGGDGFIASRIKKLYPDIDITVVDIDNPGLQKAKERGIKTIFSDCLNLSTVKDNSMDVVLGLDLLEHVEQDGLFIKEMARLLKKGGKFILTTPVEKGVSFPFISKANSEKFNKNWGHIRKGYSIENLRKLLETSGLKITKTGGYFNILSRYAYWLKNYAPIRIKGSGILFRSIAMLEPYIKWGTQEHIIIGRK